MHLYLAIESRSPQISIVSSYAFAAGRLVVFAAGGRFVVFAPSVRNKRRAFALATETLRHVARLDAAVETAGLARELAALRVPRALLLLMLHDLLVSARGAIDGAGRVKRALVAHAPALRAALAKLPAPAPAAAAAGAAGADPAPPPDRAADPTPRYARVNALRSSVVGMVGQNETDRSGSYLRHLHRRHPSHARSQAISDRAR